MSTSSESWKRYSLGSRTAWLPPLLKSLARSAINRHLPARAYTCCSYFRAVPPEALRSPGHSPAAAGSGASTRRRHHHAEPWVVDRAERRFAPDARSPWRLLRWRSAYKQPFPVQLVPAQVTVQYPLALQ